MPGRYMGNPGQPAPTYCAVRLFDQQYAVNITVAVDDRIGFSDMIAGSSAAVYRIGCSVPPLPTEEAPNLVFDGASLYNIVDHADRVLTTRQYDCCWRSLQVILKM